MIDSFGWCNREEMWLVNSGCSPILNGPQLVKQVPLAGVKNGGRQSAGRERMEIFFVILLKSSFFSISTLWNIPLLQVPWGGRKPVDGLKIRYDTICR
ncbi:hypothetical protein [uncultured Desulfobulbus sp.]|uniref:hypothetical protein n=1 Tax=uncultured Desulfobulbus sp. TaxID=239745 RepID=UPI00261BE435|nr:hypothetical protein [uncultured Desulfobulbus sp.]